MTSSNVKKNAFHNERMKRKKAQIEASMAQAQTEKGVCQVITGHGKGKSTSAFGMVARALGHGLNVGVCQFIKSRTDTGEEAFLGAHPNCDWHVLGDGFTWDTQNRNQDIITSKKGWQIAQDFLSNSKIDLVVLDELTYLLNYEYLEAEIVTNAIIQRPVMQHVIITGRSAPTALRDLADTVSDIKDEKHAYTAGIKAQAGFDF